MIAIGNTNIRISNIKQYGISSEEIRFQRIYLYDIADSILKRLITSDYSPTDCFVNVNSCYNNWHKYDSTWGTIEYINRCFAVDESTYNNRFKNRKCLPEKYKGKRIVYDSKVAQEYSDNDVKFVKCKYLYITTYQKDNYKFYQSIDDKHLLTGYDVEKLKKKIDKAFSETNSSEKNPYEKIKELKELLDMGAITKKEFEEKKKELLSRY